MKKHYLIGLIALVILLGAFSWWQHWVHSPQYSLMQAKKAFEQHDLTNFRKYVDVESVTARILDQLLDDFKEENKPVDQWEAMGQTFAENMFMALKPQLAKMAKEQVEYYVEQGSFKQTQSQTGSNFSLEEVTGQALAKENEYQGIEYVKKEGKIATVGIKVLQAKYNVPLILEIKMRKQDGYWQVAELSNLIQLTKKIDQLEIARINQLNQPLIQKIKESLVLQDLKKSQYTDEWGMEEKVIFTVHFKNMGSKEIDEYHAVITYKDQNGQKIGEYPLTDQDNIKPGQIGGGEWAKEINPFTNEDKLLYESNNLQFTVNITKIKFMDGTEIKLWE